MEVFKKTYWVIFPLILFICLFLLDKIFHVDNFLIRTLVAGSVAFILSPRRKIIQTEKGKIKQVTWIFLKKPVIID